MRASSVRSVYHYTSDEILIAFDEAAIPWMDMKVVSMMAVKVLDKSQNALATPEG